MCEGLKRSRTYDEIDSLVEFHIRRSALCLKPVASELWPLNCDVASLWQQDVERFCVKLAKFETWTDQIAKYLIYKTNPICTLLASHGNESPCSLLPDAGHLLTLVNFQSCVLLGVRLLMVEISNSASQCSSLNHD